MRQDSSTFAGYNLAKSKLPRYTIEMAFQENVATGTAQSATGTTLRLAASSSAVTDYYVNMVVEITGGTGAGQKRTVTAYDDTTKDITVAAWDTNPDNTSTYRIDDLYYLTSHPQADSAIVASAPVTYNVIEKLSGTSQQIFPDEGRATIGAISFSVVDKSSAVTSKIYAKLADGYGLKGKRVRFYLGYDGLTWTDYCLIQTQIVDSISFNADGSYAIQCADVNRSVRTDIFDPKTTTLSKSITATQLLIPVYSVTGFTAVAHGTSYSDATSTSVGYIQVDKEVIRWTSTTTDATLGLCFVADQRGALNTVAVAHQIDESATSDRRTKVTEYFYLEMPGPKLAYAILTGTLHGQGASLPDNWCLGISTDYVRLSDFTDIGTDWWDTTDDDAGFVLRFEGLKKQDAKKFLEQEVYMLLGAFSPIYSTGELGLRRMSSVLAGAAYVDALDSTSVASWTALKHDMQSVQNQIQIDWNWDALQGKFTRTNLLIDADSINVHGAAKLKNLKFLGLHGSRHSYAALTTRFNAYRDRYAGPPMKFDATLLPSKNVLEVGDIVRVQPPKMRDFVTGTTFDRSMEVQSVKIDWITGKVTASLFASSQAATSLTPDSTGAGGNGTGTPPLANSWYTSAGTSLVTYLAANYPANYTDAGGILTITDDVTLPGDASLASAIYYYAGDVTINSGVTVTITDNVWIRYSGHLTNNGTIDGKGQGIAASVSGTAGYYGNTQAAGGVLYHLLSPHLAVQSTQTPIVFGTVATVPNLDVYTTGGILSGMPDDLRGSSGSRGGSVVDYDLSTVGTGGVGGAGGAGLMLTGRGMSFGVNGKIDLSGNDGTAGTVTTPHFVDIYTGAGAGGAPGALVLFLDGANSVLPDLTSSTIVQNYGSTATQGTPLSQQTVQYNWVGQETFPAQSYFTGWGGFSAGQAGYRVQYLPENTAATDDISQPLPDVSGFSAAQNGAVVVFKWTQVNDTRLIGYDIRYAKQGTTDWDAAIPLTQATRGTQITSAAIPPGDWTTFIKARDIDGHYSTNAATYDLTVTNAYDIIYQEAQAPDWTGSIYATGDALLMEDGSYLLQETGDKIVLESGTNTLVRHWTGVLVPNSQDAASVDGTFDSCVPNPVPTCIYETAEIDVGFDSNVRIWGSVRAHLGPDETGSTDVDLYMDEHTGAGSYDGFEPWTIGVKATRYVKQRIEFDTADGVRVLDDFTPTVDVEERIETYNDQVIAAGGTTITFADEFHTTPNVVATAKGASVLIATYDTPTTTSVRVHVLNTGGSDVGGTVNIKVTGA